MHVDSKNYQFVSNKIGISPKTCDVTSQVNAGMKVDSFVGTGKHTAFGIKNCDFLI